MSIIFSIYGAIGLNISSDIVSDVGIDVFDEHNHHIKNHPHNWLHHINMVPKGFLRYHVLQALSQKPMSGSEVMDQIQKHTSGAWKPSPGSIYPLLSSLEDSAYIKELPKENGVKRYQITENGKSLIEKEHQNLRNDMNKVREHMSSFQTFAKNLPPEVPFEKNTEIIQALKQFDHAAFHLRNALQEKCSEQVTNEALTIIKEATTKLEELNRKVQESESPDNEPK